ncbi:MAG: VCBS repeat-containing protein [Planctomycetota bacterium]|nr:VCBS repeat-containing protein [Planctomycetota bacterium]
MTAFWTRWIVIGLCAVTAEAILAADNDAPAGQRLERLKYNHPGLAVDLGVGLWAFPLPMDFNGDGRLDLVVDCPDQPYNGVYVFENPGSDTAQNPLPVFKPGRRISKGLQMVQLSLVDGQPRVLGPATEFVDFFKSGLEGGVKLPLPANVHPQKVRGNFWRYVDFDGDGQLDIIVGADDWTEYGWDNAYDASGRWTRGPLRGFVYLVRNTGTNEKPVYEKPLRVLAGDKPVETFGWPCPSFADFRGTGKLDLICGEFRDSFTFFENIGTRTAPKYAPGRPLTLPPESAGTAAGPPRLLTMDLEMITPVAIDWNKDGRVDLICGDEDGRVAYLENTGRLAANGAPQFLPPRYFQQEADELKCGALATPVGFDWDGDGAMDIVSGNTAGYLVFFKNLSGPGVEKPQWAAPQFLEADGRVIRFMAGPNGSIQGPAEAKWGYTTLSVADWDGDGLPDLVVNSIWGKVVWFRNIGTRRAPQLAAAQPIEVEWDGPQPAMSYGWLRPEGKALLTQWRTTPVAVDWNQDGLTDLVMLDQEGYLAFFERARREGRLVLLPPQRVFCNEQGAPLRLSAGSAGRSGRRKLCIVDWDGDGRLDILLNAANARFLRQVDARDGKWYFQDLGLLVQQNIEGHDVSPTVVDFNGDGIPDFLGGAEDGHFYYLKNPRTK